MATTQQHSRAASSEVRHQHGVTFLSQQGRLMSAFVELAAEQGYDAVTIIEIVTRAGTSKRTFYEFFRDKQDCLVQSFDTARQMLAEVILAEAGAAVDPIERIEAGVRAYIAALADQPHFARLFLTESFSAGRDLTDRWIESLELLADQIVNWRDTSRGQHPDVPEISQQQAIAVISGINELVAITIHREGMDAVAARADELADLATALLTAGSHH